jgi:hypothetical protein
MDAGLDAIEADLKATETPEPPQAPPAAAAPAVEAVKTDEAAPTEPTSEVSSPSSTPAQRSKDYEDWLTKWGGPDRDPNVAARATWDMNNDRARAAKAPEPEQAPPAKEPEPVVHPDVARFDESMRAIESQYAKVKSDFEDADKKAVEVAARIREIEHLRAFDETLDFEKDQALVKELRAKYAEADRLQRSLETIQTKADLLNDRYLTQKNLKAQAETLVTLTQAREAEITERDRRESDAKINTFAATFFSEMEKAAKDIPEELVADFKQFAKDKSHVKLNVEDLPTTDVPAFIAKAKEDYLAAIDRAHRIKSKVYAANKAKDAEVNAPDGPAAVAEAPKKGTPRSQEEFERHIESLSAGL